MFGMDFRFSGNNGNIECALHLRRPVCHFNDLLNHRMLYLSALFSLITGTYENNIKTHTKYMYSNNKTIKANY